jgi:hypothetical protein
MLLSAHYLHGFQRKDDVMRVMLDFGIDIRPQYPPYFSDWLTWALHQWSAAENLIAPKLDFGEVRPEFYDFASLLRRCAPGAMDCAFGAGYDGAFLEGIGE